MKSGVEREEQLLEELNSLRRRLLEIEAAEREPQWVEHSSNERAKELDSIISIDRVIDELDITVDEVYRKVANLVPNCWLHPEIICVRIAIAGKEFKTRNYRETEWGLPWDIRVGGEKVGLLEVNYLEERPKVEEALFSKEKRRVIATIAERLGRITERKQAEEALREIKEHFRALAESNSECIWVINTDYVYTYLNPKVKDLIGFEPEELIGKSFFDLMSPEDGKRLKPVMEGIMKSQKPFERLENPGLHKDGGLVVVESSGVPFFDSDGQLLGYRGIDRSITQRKRAEEALRESEKFSSSLLNHTPNPIVVISPDTSIGYINPAFEKLTGFFSAELIGKKAPYPWWTEEERKKIGEDFEVAMQSEARNLEQLFQKADGDRFWVEKTSSMVKTGDELRYYLESWVDVTERKQLRENMQFYITQVTRAQEEERKRIAHELHDETTQALFNLLTDVDEISEEIQLPEKAVKRLQQLMDKIRSIMKGIRRLSHELRPGVLDRFGLLPSIELLAREVKEGGHINCHLKIIGSERRISPETELVLFRVTQEALRNIKKHSNATRTEISVEFTKEKVKLSINDNGCGFEVPGLISNFARKGKFGLLGMYERTRLLNGQFSMKSEVGQGTTVSVEVPHRSGL